jgi:hypothetical protein
MERAYGQATGDAEMNAPDKDVYIPIEWQSHDPERAAWIQKYFNKHRHMTGGRDLFGRDMTVEEMCERRQELEDNRP